MRACFLLLGLLARVTLPTDVAPRAAFRTTRSMMQARSHLQTRFDATERSNRSRAFADSVVQPRHLPVHWGALERTSLCDARIGDAGAAALAAALASNSCLQRISCVRAALSVNKSVLPSNFRPQPRWECYIRGGRRELGTRAAPEPKYHENQARS